MYPASPLKEALAIYGSLPLAGVAATATVSIKTITPQNLGLILPSFSITPFPVAFLPLKKNQ
jgi:hypothetical protein